MSFVYNSSLRRSTPLRRGKRLRPVSPKRAKRLASWPLAQAEVYRRSGGLCEARIEGVCTGRMEHTHHRRLRSQGGTDDPANLAGLCHACHRWCHDHPHFASELGLIVMREPVSSAVVKVERT